MTAYITEVLTPK